MTTTNTNGSVRKTLASQIDRLDSLLDGLAENLNEAVAAAVKEAVTVAVEGAVRAAVLEVLTNDDLRKRLTPPQPKPATVPFADKARRCWVWLTKAAKDAWQAVQAVALGVAAQTTQAASIGVGVATVAAEQAAQKVKQFGRTGWMLAAVLA